MGQFKQWIESNPHAQFQFPLLKLTPVGWRQMIGTIGNHPFKRDPNQDLYRCDNCGHLWQRSKGLGNANYCPRCGSNNFKQSTKE